MSLFLDWRDQASWGRFAALIALVMAVQADLRGQDLAHVSLWLGMAFSNYGTSKVAEMILAPKGGSNG